MEVPLSLWIPQMYCLHFRWVLKLPTSHKCNCSHPVQIHDTNHAHFLTSFQLSQPLADGCPYRARKELHSEKWRPYMTRRLFSKPICAKKERSGPPRADQGLSTLEPRSSHTVCTLQMHPPTSPCLSLSAGTKPKSQGHCWKWHHKLKAV